MPRWVRVKCVDLEVLLVPRYVSSVWTWRYCSSLAVQGDVVWEACKPRAAILYAGERQSIERRKSDQLKTRQV